jgi:hypothetical protein
MNIDLKTIFNVGGLFLGTLAAVIMAFNPPRVRMFGTKGEEIGPWANKPDPKNEGRGKRQIFLSKLGPWLLAFGFLLQLIATFLPS